MNNNMNEQPLVSIIMNCYNGETYLQESINSVLFQTYQNSTNERRLRNLRYG